MSIDQRDVIVADDHPLLRRGLIDVLRADGTFNVVGEAADGEQALALIRSLKPHFAILDIEMPRRGGLEVAAQLGRDLPSVKVIVLSMHNSRDMLEGALDAGARGYVLKDNAAVDVLACLNLVAEDGTYVSPVMAQHLVARRAEPRAQDPVELALSVLTPSEREVLRLIAAGRSSPEIGDALHIRPKTVEHHRSHICAKLGITGINALVRFAAEHRNRLE